MVHCPYGAWPSQCYNYYDNDSHALKEYDKASKYQDAEDAKAQLAKAAAKAEKAAAAKPEDEKLAEAAARAKKAADDAAAGVAVPETFKDYLDKWVYSVKDHDELLDKIGGARLMRLKNEPPSGLFHQTLRVGRFTTMADYTKYTKQEMQAYAIAKNIKENQIVIVGTGLPLIGASLAKRVVCPSCHPIVESGLMDCSPVEVPRSVGDNRFMAHCAVQWPNIRFIGFEANEWLHDADRLIAFIGGAQIDPYGNVNSTCIYGKGDYVKPQTRFTGSGGANGIATFCNTIIMMQHQKRRFMEKIDYITSCGWMDGPGGRERAGLPGNRGPQMVVTDLGIMKFDEETKRMYLAYYYPFSSLRWSRRTPAFEVDVSRAQLFEGPSPEIIRVIREEIDPGQAFIKVPKE